LIFQVLFLSEFKDFSANDASHRDGFCLAEEMRFFLIDSSWGSYIRLLYLHKVKRVKRKILYQRLVWRGTIKKMADDVCERIPAISIHPFVA